MLSSFVARAPQSVTPLFTVKSRGTTFGMTLDVCALVFRPQTIYSLNPLQHVSRRDLWDG